MFNRYGVGQHFAVHVDNAVRGDHLTGARIRTDLSVTLFLSEPDEYDGGELIVEDYYGSHEVKLPAGHLVLYPASSLHTVTPVTRGVRVASFFWLQSMIRDGHARSLIFDLDTAIQGLAAAARPQRCGRRQAYRHLSQPDPLLGRSMKLLCMRAAGGVLIVLATIGSASPLWAQGRQAAPAGSTPAAQPVATQPAAPQSAMRPVGHA